MMGSGVCGTVVGGDIDSAGVGVVFDGGCVGRIGFHRDGNRGVAPNIFAGGRSLLRQKTNEH